MAKQEEIPQIDRIAAETIIVPIIGTTPLIVHRFSEKAKRQMLEAMQGIKRTKEHRDPKAEFIDAAYRMNRNGGDRDRYGFPSLGFKEATVGAARFYPKNKVTMTGLRQFIFFKGEMGEDRIGLVPILKHEDADVDSNTEWPRMREDPVTVGVDGRDLRYRPEFWPWRADLKVTYVTSALSRGSVLSLIDAGGLGVGVGEWRPQKRGDFGTYRVDLSKEITVIGS